MRWMNVCAALAACVLVAACGGGGSEAGSSPFGSGSGGGTGGTGGGGGTGGTGGTGTGTQSSGLGIALALSSNTVTVGNPATVTATVTNRNGPVAGALVTFSTTGNTGAFTPSAGTALTDASGTAVVSLSPATPDGSGASLVTATTTVNSETVEARSGFQLTATNVSIASFSTGLPAGAALGPYGQAVPVVTVSGVASGSPVTVTVTSNCIAAGRARISPASVTTTTGTATFTYTDNQCGAFQANDTLTASIANVAATRQATLPVTSPAASSITYVSANPSTIFLRGSGLTQQSTVSFQVVDSAGNPLPNRRVSLELSTFAGGLTIDNGTVPITKDTDGQGRVDALVNSGTVPTPVRVRATLVGTTISTVSNELTVGIGLPAQANFGLAQTAANIEGYDYIDTPNSYAVVASDRRGNPVPAGTAITFTAEGGQIETRRVIELTSLGIARADAAFVSNLPKPLDGRVTIVAYALGEESFKDLNGNNVFDAGEPFQDLGDVYVDRQFNGIPESDDEFISLQLPSSTLPAACVNTTDAELRLDVTVPSRPTGAAGGPTCDGRWGQAYVRRAIETVLSTSAARPLWLGASLPVGWTPAPGSTLALRTDTTAATRNFIEVAGTTVGSGGVRGELSFLVADANPVRLNPMPAGTTISVAGSPGLTATLVGGSPVVSTTGATLAALRYEFETSVVAGEVRSATITFTSPKGVGTVVSLRITR